MVGLRLQTRVVRAWVLAVLVLPALPAAADPIANVPENLFDPEATFPYDLDGLKRVDAETAIARDGVPRAVVVVDEDHPDGYRELADRIVDAVRRATGGVVLPVRDDDAVGEADYGGSLILKQALLPGVIVAFIQYIQRIYHPIRDIAEKYNIMQAAMASSERIFNLLDTEETVKNPPAPRRPQQLQGAVDFKDVWLSYRPGEPVLKGISFRVEPGEKIALVGATGGGKTSIISALCRFYELERGAILVDGVDIRYWNKQDLRRHLGLVLQDVFLFSGNMADNITLGDPRISEARMQEAARRVHIAPFIEHLPAGYQEEVQERGATLSQGQRQLLSFARALAFDPKILILDEATSSVDTRTEILIQKALQELLKDRTALIISHRLSTIKNVNRILVIHKGKIWEEGNHQELLARQGLYSRLYELQYRAQENGDQTV